MRRECRERFPRLRFPKKARVSDPDMHHCTWVTHVPWCMSGSLTNGGRENVPGVPGACATRNFAYLARGPCSRNHVIIFILGIYSFLLKSRVTESHHIMKTYACEALFLTVCGCCLIVVRKTWKQLARIPHFARQIAFCKRLHQPRFECECIVSNEEVGNVFIVTRERFWFW